MNMNTTQWKKASINHNIVWREVKE